MGTDGPEETATCVVFLRNFSTVHI